MKTITSISGGKTSAYLAKHYPTDENIFALVRIEDRKCTPKDKTLVQKVLLNEIKIRRLTPLECERLPTVKDGYTSVVSDTQRYKMLGNGWTVDVIAHIFSYLNF